MAKLTLAEIVEQTSEKVVEWANSPENNGPFSEEIYRTNVQIFGALTLLADALRSQSTPDILRSDDHTPVSDPISNKGR